MVERNTHLLAWLEGGYWSCRYGGQAWAEGYLHNARDVIVDQDARIAQLERDLAEAREYQCPAHQHCTKESRIEKAESDLAEARAEIMRWNKEWNDAENRLEAAEAERDRLAAEVERLTTEADYRDLKDHWHSFCDADPFEGGDTFAERMGARGLIELVAVTQDALEDGFAAERGIVPDGYMWQLTEVGRASLQTGEKGE